ncbi:MAG TPA: alpha/beta hydrolase-fold protein, partial [Flavisolibacter sp.]|nr:alpha/beta hydrolase-fold protein [Flavisolibacter sp.]
GVCLKHEIRKLNILFAKNKDYKFIRQSHLMHKYLFVFLIVFSKFAFAGKVDTVSIYSAAMQKSFNCVVITPDAYKKKKGFPVIYLLHGHGGSYNNWIKRVPQLANYADEYQTIIVCPDGAVSSWYYDSPVDSTMRFETHIATEVPAYIDAHYKTIKDRKARAITGLSMGGHGGLFLGFRHADFFGACGSMSGALVIDFITKGYGVEKRLGDTLTNRQYYRDLSIMHEMENYPKDSVAIIMDCGTEDFIVEMSRMAHKKMLDLKIPHDYIERPGKHDWKYWATAIQYQLLYFRNYFDRMLIQQKN